MDSTKPSADPIDGRALIGYGWIGLVGGFLTYSLWFAGIRKLPVTATALLGLVSPLIAAMVGVVFAGESLSASQLIGFGLALVAMVAVQLAAPARRAQAEQVS